MAMLKKVLFLLVLIWVFFPLPSFSGEESDFHKKKADIVLDADLSKEIFRNDIRYSRVPVKVDEGGALRESYIEFGEVRNKSLAILLYQNLRNQEKILRNQEEIMKRISALEESGGRRENRKETKNDSYDKPATYHAPVW